MNTLRVSARQTSQRIFAALCIVGGVCSTLVQLFNDFNPASTLWSETILVDPRLTKGRLDGEIEMPLQARAGDEWPLVVAAQLTAQHNNDPERYIVEISSIPLSPLLIVRATGNSPERTHTFNDWLTSSFVQGLRRSYDRHEDSRSYKPALLNADTTPTPSHRRAAVILTELLAPLCLTASGWLLLHAIKPAYQNSLTTPAE